MAIALTMIRPQRKIFRYGIFLFKCVMIAMLKYVLKIIQIYFNEVRPLFVMLITEEVPGGKQIPKRYYR